VNRGRAPKASGCRYQSESQTWSKAGDSTVTSGWLCTTEVLSQAVCTRCKKGEGSADVVFCVVGE
jgi:hypothetical protein